MNDRIVTHHSGHTSRGITFVHDIEQATNKGRVRYAAARYLRCPLVVAACLAILICELLVQIPVAQADPSDLSSSDQNGSASPQHDGPVADNAAADDSANDRAIAAAGIRKLTSRHLALYTDLPADPEIDSLPRVFDLAVPGWCEYFGIEPAAVENWQMRGCLMGDRNKFRRAGLLPEHVANIPHGYSRGNNLWWDEQPSAYYRRHLMLHEGTHGFMNTQLGGCGPGWYMEGMAEMLATHRLSGEQLQLGYLPQRREEVARLGRIGLVQKAVAAHGVKPLAEVLQYDNGHVWENEAYAWCWALATFLDGHPRYRQRFRAMQNHVTDADFTDKFIQQYRDDWPQLAEEWQVFAGTLVHGQDIPRTAIEFKAGEPLRGDSAQCTIRANRGWQSSGIQLAAGTKYDVTARGRYQIGQVPKTWWCEPGGVTIRYHAGSPLGILQAAILPEPGASDNAGQPPSHSAFLAPVDVGLGTQITPQQTGTLYLRINDSPAELSDNQGELEVVVSTVAHQDR